MEWDNSSSSVHFIYPAYKGKLLIGYFITNDGTQNLKVSTCIMQQKLYLNIDLIRY